MKQKRDNSALIKKYKSEPKVGVLGSTMFKTTGGDRLTFTYNGFPVSIKFDGTVQKYPKSIAKVLERKLNEIAESNARKEINTEVFM